MEQLDAGTAIVGGVTVSAIVSECLLIHFYLLNVCLSSVYIAATLAFVLRQFFLTRSLDVYAFMVSFHHVFIPEFCPSALRMPLLYS